MVQPGKDIMAGLWKGLKAKWKNIITWFKKLPGTVKQSAGLIGDGLKSIFVDEGSGGVDSKKFKLSNKKHHGARSLSYGNTESTHTVKVRIKKKAGESLAKTVGNKVDVTVNRKKGWKDSTAKWMGNKVDVTVNRKKSWTNTLKNFLGIGNDPEEAKIKRTSTWTNTLANFLGIDQTQNARIGRKPGWTTTLAAFLGTNKAKTVKINRKKNWRTTLSEWIGKAISVIVNLKKGSATGIGGWLYTIITSVFGVKKKAEGGVFSHGSWKPITAYAGGGSPGGGQLFVAREAGPELVGTLGGSTAVMNNKQIVSSVAAGVASAVQDVLVPALMSRGEGPSGDLVVFLGDEEVARSSMRGMKKIDKQQHPVIQLQGV